MSLARRRIIFCLEGEGALGKKYFYVQFYRMPDNISLFSLLKKALLC